MSLLLSAICKASSDNYFAFLHLFIYFFFLAMVLINTSYTMFGTSVHSFSGILSIISNSLNLFFTFIIKSPGILFRSYPNALVAFPTFFNLSLNFALRTSWSEEQSAPGLVFADFIELLHLLHQSVDVHVTLPNYIPFDDLNCWHSIFK